MFKIFKSRGEFLFFFVLTIVSLVASASVYALHFNGPPIRSDGLGYYVYLPTVFVYNDLSMNEFIDAYSKHYNDPPTDYWNGVYKYEDTGNYLNKYPVGVAVMSAPFFLLAHLGTLALSSVSGVPPNGFTDPLYHAAQSFSGLFYAIVGLILLKRILDKYFRAKVVYASLLAITFGTNLFHYFTYDAVFSHAYSFFLFTIFIYLTLKWYRNPNKLTSILIGLTTGLITIVRPTNLIVVLFFVFYGISFKYLRKELLQRVKLFLTNYKQLVLITLASLLVTGIQVLYWYIITGKLFVYSYTEEYFDFSKPEIFNVLFSIRKGLFFWSPILLLAIPGFYFISKKIKGYSLTVILFLLINVYIVSSWWSWWYGGGFGMRALIETFPFLALPIAVTIERISTIRNINLKRLLFTLIIVSCLFTIYLMIQYWRGYLPIDGTDWSVFLNAILNREKVPIF